MTVGQEGPSLTCDLPLGRPGLTVHNELVLTGWVVSRRGISGVAVQIGERQWNAGFGLDTPSLPAQFPDMPAADRSGYELRIDTSKWGRGQHYVTVAAFDTDGERTAVEGWIDVLPFESAHESVAEARAALASGGIALFLDEPEGERWTEAVDGAVAISGWAHAHAGIEAVLVTVDGRHQHEALRPIVRPDVIQDIGADVAGEAGFVSRVDEVQCPPGRHTILVVAVARDGRAVGAERQIVVSTAPATQPKPPDTEARGTTEPDLLASDADLRAMIVHWQDRALLAETDAALSRTELDLARTQQERTAWELEWLKARFAEADA
jgi:hypothetical protein